MLFLRLLDFGVLPSKPLGIEFVDEEEQVAPVLIDDEAFEVAVSADLGHQDRLRAALVDVSDAGQARKSGPDPVKMCREEVLHIIVDFGGGFGRKRRFALLTAEIVDPRPIVGLFAGSGRNELPREPAF
jgi:hypothetical protein